MMNRPRPLSPINMALKILVITCPPSFVMIGQRLWELWPIISKPRPGSFIKEICLFILQSRILKLVLIESIFQKFYSFYCFSHYPNLQNSSQADLYGPRGFFVEHIELDCVKYQVNQNHSVRGVAFQIIHFQTLITAPPSG